MSTLCSVVSAASAQLSALLSSLAPREIYYIGGPEPLPAPLTPAEEQALLARLDTDGAAVRTTLIEHNLRLVAHIVKKYYGLALRSARSSRNDAEGSSGHSRHFAELHQPPRKADSASAAWGAGERRRICLILARIAEKTLLSPK